MSQGRRRKEARENVLDALRTVLTPDAERSADQGDHRREAECCSFLDLAPEESEGKLILSIDAPADGKAVADELAGSSLQRRS